MFQPTQRFQKALAERLNSSPVNARLLLVSADIQYDETPLPEGTLSVLRKCSKYGFTLNVSQTLGERTLNQVCAHALAHIILHDQKFEDGDDHVDMLKGFESPFPNTAKISTDDEAAAHRLAIEILIPTVALREQLTYTQGNFKAMAAHFQQPVALIHRALILQQLMDPRSTTTEAA